MGVNKIANTLGLTMAFSSIGFLLASPFAGQPQVTYTRADL
jgi:hypothetical protein